MSKTQSNLIPTIIKQAGCNVDMIMRVIKLVKSCTVLLYYMLL